MSAEAVANPLAFGRDVGRSFTPPEGVEIIDGEAQPNAWPACSTCGTAYVRRLGISLSNGLMWAWFRDCKHRADFTIRTSIEEDA